jgi:pheromone shutdown protein TraB
LRGLRRLLAAGLGNLARAGSALRRHRLATTAGRLDELEDHRQELADEAKNLLNVESVGAGRVECLLWKTGGNHVLLDVVSLRLAGLLSLLSLRLALVGGWLLWHGFLSLSGHGCALTSTSSSSR